MPVLEQPTNTVQVRFSRALDKPLEELKALASICLHANQEERIRRLDTLHEDWFLGDVTRAIYRRLRGYRAQSNSVPNYETMCVDTSLAPEVLQTVNNLTGLAQANAYPDAADWDSFVAACRMNFITSQYHALHSAMGAIIGPAINGDYSSMGQIAQTIATYQASVAKHVATRKSPIRVGTDSSDNSALLDEILLSDRSAGRIKTGFRVFDTRTGGLRKGQAILLMSRYGGGKSAMALSMAINMAREGKRGAYISFELGDSELYERFLTNISGIDGNKIRLGGTELDNSERERIRARQAEFNMGVGSLDLICPNTLSAGGWDINDTLQVIEGCGYDFVVFDYLGLIQYHKLEGISQAREDQIFADMARKIKVHCESHQYVAVVLHQMTEEGKIAGSRAIGAHMDFIWKWAVQDEDRERGWVTVEQDKARGAPTYDMIFTLTFQFMKMMNLQDPPTTDMSDPQRGPRSLQGGSEGRYSPLQMSLQDFT